METNILLIRDGLAEQAREIAEEEQRKYQNEQIALDKAIQEEIAELERASRPSVHCPVCQYEITPDEMDRQGNETETIRQPIGKIPQEILWRRSCGTAVHCPCCDSDFLKDAKSRTEVSDAFPIATAGVACLVLLFSLILFFSGFITQRQAQQLERDVSYAIEHRLDEPVEAEPVEEEPESEPEAEQKDIIDIIKKSCDALGLNLGELLFFVKLTGISQILLGVYNVVRSSLLNEPERRIRGVAMTLVGACLIGCGMIDLDNMLAAIDFIS